MTTLVETISTSRYGTWLEIRRSRLIQNLKAIKKSHGKPVHVMAIIKSNAYGHGTLEVARTLEGEADYFGVSSLREAFDLREHEIKTPVFIFGRLPNQEIPVALMDGITLSVSSFEEAAEISELSQALDRKTTVHVKVDTGMGRLGIPYSQAVAVIEKINQLPSITLEGIYTHFPTAELDDGFTDRQAVDFAALIAELGSRGIHFRFRHAANSAGILKIGHTALNMIRPGLSLYGIYPDETLRKLVALAPILTLKSHIIAFKQLRTGESAGYGRSFVASKPTNIAVLPIGYSHGYPFTASNKSFVLYRGKRYPLAGKVSMDYITINLGDTVARTGDEITLIGQDQDEVIRAEDLARWAGTIPYEIVTRLLPSLPRLFV